MISYKTLDNGIIEMIPSDGYRLVKFNDRISAQGSVFLPSTDFAEGWEEKTISEVDALEAKWQEESEKEMEGEEDER